MSVCARLPANITEERSKESVPIIHFGQTRIGTRDSTHCFLFVFS